MATLTLTTRGQLTIRKEFLEHIGVMPGDRIHMEKTVDGKLTLERAEPQGSWQDLAGILKGKTNGAVLTRGLRLELWKPTKLAFEHESHR